MEIYDKLKDILSIVQRADNIDLYQKLLDLTAQAFDMQDEISRLREENEMLKKNKILEEDIEYYVTPYITRKTDIKPIKYCAACWGSKKILIPIQNLNNDNKYTCGLCHVTIRDKSI